MKPLEQQLAEQLDNYHLRKAMNDRLGMKTEPFQFKEEGETVTLAEWCRLRGRPYP